MGICVKAQEVNTVITKEVTKTKYRRHTLLDLPLPPLPDFEWKRCHGPFLPDLPEEPLLLLLLLLLLLPLLPELPELEL